MRSLILILFLAAGSAAAADSLEDGRNAYEDADFDTALRIFLHLAAEGDVTAQFNLARMYDTGRGVAPDPALAFHWYRLAAEQGHRAAQFIVGLKYQRGDGVDPDAAQAARWYRRSARQGYAGAQLNLGAMYALGDGVPKDDVRALAWWILAASHGNTLAIRNRDLLAAKLDPAFVSRAEQLSRELEDR